MGNIISQSKCYQQYPELIGTIDCDLANYNLGNVSERVKSNPEIAGIGVSQVFYYLSILSFVFESISSYYIFKVDLAFAITSILSLICSGTILVFCDYKRKASWRKLLEPAALSFSDQQIVTGIALSVSTMYFETICEISAYHYNIVCFLVLLSIVSHLVGIVGLRGYTTKRPQWLGIIRMLLIAVQVFLVFRLFSGRSSSLFPIYPPADSNLTSLVLPFVCFQDLNETLLYEVDPKHTSEGLVLLGFLAVFYAIILLLAEVSKLSFVSQQWDDASQDKPNDQS
jgi:hypothetical protein